jgi:CO dehydrogenase/acetyl-CoA synthase beta subunit
VKKEQNERKSLRRLKPTVISPIKEEEEEEEEEEREEEEEEEEKEKEKEEEENIKGNRSGLSSSHILSLRIINTVHHGELQMITRT